MFQRLVRSCAVLLGGASVAMLSAWDRRRRAGAPSPSSTANQALRCQVDHDDDERPGLAPDRGGSAASATAKSARAAERRVAERGRLEHVTPERLPGRAFRRSMPGDREGDAAPHALLNGTARYWLMDAISRRGGMQPQTTTFRCAGMFLAATVDLAMLRTSRRTRSGAWRENSCFEYSAARRCTS